MLRNDEVRSETNRQHSLGLPVGREAPPKGKDMVSALAISSSAVPVAAVFVSVPGVAQIAAAPLAAIFVSVPVAAQVPLVVSVSFCFPS